MNSSYLESTFIDACDCGDTTKVKACIDLGVDVNWGRKSNDDTGLLIAARHNYVELCDLLLSHPKIQVNKIGGWEGITALMMSCWKDNPEITRKLLLKPEIDTCIFSSGYTAAMYAAQKSADCLEMIVKFYGVDWNVQNGWGFSAAMFAVQAENIEGLKFLMSNVSSIDWNLKTDRVGDTVAHLATYSESGEVLRLLKDNPKIDWNIANHKGDTALTLALKNNNHEYARLLFSIPSINLQAHNLDDLNIPREVLVECMRDYNQQQQQIHQQLQHVNRNMNTLMDKMGFSSPECPVCLSAFTADRQVFLCVNGHFTCGICRERMENCPKCRGDFVGRAHDYENILTNNM